MEAPDGQLATDADGAGHIVDLPDSRPVRVIPRNGSNAHNLREGSTRGAVCPVRVRWRPSSNSAVRAEGDDPGLSYDGSDCAFPD